MNNDEFLKQAFKSMNQEASWCCTCRRRDKCNMKETVAMEQRLINPYPVKHLKVTVQCEEYIKDGKLPPDKGDYLRSLFII